MIFCAAGMAETWDMDDLNGTWGDEPSCKNVRVVPPSQKGPAIKCDGRNCPLTSASPTLFQDEVLDKYDHGATQVTQDRCALLLGLTCSEDLLGQKGCESICGLVICRGVHAT